ncbi:hypothetical protein V6N13_068595 [Hibiscus sabdariffa]
MKLTSFHEKRLVGSMVLSQKIFLQDSICMPCPWLTWKNRNTKLFQGVTEGLYGSRGLFSFLSRAVRLHLCQEVSETKIRAVVFEMGPLKAPSIDGFHALFYQK